MLSGRSARRSPVDASSMPRVSGAALQPSELAPGLLIGDGVTIGDGRADRRARRHPRRGEIGAGARIGDHAQIRDGARIGVGATIGSLSSVDPEVTVGARASVQARCYLSAGTVVEDDAFIGPGVTLANDNTMDRHGPETELAGPAAAASLPGRRRRRRLPCDRDRRRGLRRRRRGGRRRRRAAQRRHGRAGAGGPRGRRRGSAGALALIAPGASFQPSCVVCICMAVLSEPAEGTRASGGRAVRCRQRRRQRGLRPDLRRAGRHDLSASLLHVNSAADLAELEMDSTRDRRPRLRRRPAPRDGGAAPHSAANCASRRSSSSPRRRPAPACAARSTPAPTRSSSSPSSSRPWPSRSAPWPAGNPSSRGSCAPASSGRPSPTASARSSRSSSHGPHQRPDRRAALPLREHDQEPPLLRLRQVRCPLAQGGRRALPRA